MKTTRIFLNFFIMALADVAIPCSPEDGTDGIDGKDGIDGTDRTKPSIKTINVMTPQSGDNPGLF